MKDVDIMRNMSYCIVEKCDMCDYKSGSNFMCRAKLMRDANVIMKMQHDAMKDFPAEIEKLKAENARLQAVARFSFDEKQLVEAVNTIASDCFNAEFGDYDDEENTYLSMLNTMLRFGKMLPSKYKVLITDIRNAPKLVKE